MFSLPPDILANWLQPGALVAGAVGGMGLLIGAFRHLRSDLKGEMREMKEEMHAGEDRVNKRIDEVKDEMKDFKEQVRDEMRAGEDRTNKRIDEVKEEMRAGEARTNKRIDEVKEEMKEFKQEMGEIKTLLIQALRLPPPAQP